MLIFFAKAVNVCSTENGLGAVIQILYRVVNLIRFFVPILLILFGSLDLAKAVIAGKEDEMKKSQSALIKRFIYAAAVFLIVTLVIFVTGFIDVDGVEGTPDKWHDCWDKQ